MTREQYDAATPIIEKLKEMESELAQIALTADGEAKVIKVRIQAANGNIFEVVPTDQQLWKLNDKAALVKLQAEIDSLHAELDQV